MEIVKDDEEYGQKPRQLGGRHSEALRLEARYGAAGAALSNGADVMTARLLLLLPLALSRVVEREREERPSTVSLSASCALVASL